MSRRSNASSHSATALAEKPTVTLTALDRCDRCGAQAYVRYEHREHGQFLFCAHHDTKHRDALTAAGFEMTLDETHRLDPTA